MVGKCTITRKPFVSSDAVFPVPDLVHHHVYSGPLQQLLLCCSLAGYCYGLQDLENHPILCNSQWKTGKSLPPGGACNSALKSSVCENLKLTQLCSLFKQLVLTVGLLAVVVYLYTVVAFNFFRKFYNKSEDDDAPDMKCDDMMTVS